MKSFSTGSFVFGLFSGLVVGGALVGGGLLYLVRSGGTENVPLVSQALVEAVHNKIDEVKFAQATSLFGKVQAIGDGKLTVEIVRGAQKDSITFTYDNKTDFHGLATDNESSKIPLSASEIKIGDGVTVQTAEPVGSVANQYAQVVTRL